MVDVATCHLSPSNSMTNQDADNINDINTWCFKNGNASFPTSDVSLYSCSMMLFTAPPALFAFLSGHESQLTPLRPSNRPPTVGIRRTFAHRRVDQTQWRSSEGQFFEHPSIFIQTIHLKRKKKRKSPFRPQNCCFFVFEVEGKKTFD